jgi:PTS system glucose-specific IIA component
MTDVLAPSAGAVRPLSQAPDPVFAAEMLGSGLGIDPDLDGGVVAAVAPIAGTLVKAHPHAFVVVSDDGVGVLVHLGIDTVRLAGEGFELLVAERSPVEAGEAVTRWDPAAVAAKELSPMVLVCVMDSPAGAVRAPEAAHRVEAGDVLFSWA